MKRGDTRLTVALQIIGLVSGDARFSGCSPHRRAPQKGDNSMRNELVSPSTTVPVVEKSFRHCYCEHCGITPARFVQHILKRSLYPSARVIRWFITEDFFAPDREFIHALGFASSRKAFTGAQEEFHRFHTHGLWRRVFKLRISSNRVRDLFFSEVSD